MDAVLTGRRGAGTPLRVVAVGDVGRAVAYHVGDEAMLQGVIETTRELGVPVEWTVMSSEPERSATAWGVRAVPRLTFEDCATADERDSRLAELDRVLDLDAARWATEAPGRWRESLSAIAACDAVLLAGGGNLSRSWPHEVYERAAVARAARRSGRRIAITGQTLGPFFDERTRALTAELLAECQVVGVREKSSFALALELGVPADRARLQFDDANGVRPEMPAWWPASGVQDPFIAVTCNPFADVESAGGVGALLGQQLAEISRRTGAGIVLVPHVGDTSGAQVHDVAMAHQLAAMAGDSQRWVIAPLPSPAEAVWLTAHASLVISSRYHPVVFAAATATPSLFLSQDYYTFVKGAGALDLVGLASWTMPVGVAARGELVPAALELWERRGEIQAHLKHIAPDVAAHHRRHVQRVLAMLSASPAESAGPIPQWSGPAARGAWMEVARDAAWGAGISQQQLASAEVHVRALTDALAQKEAALVAAQASFDELSRNTAQAHVDWQNERASLVAWGEEHERRVQVAGDAVAALQRQIERQEAELRTAIAALEELTSSTRDAHVAWAADRAALVERCDQLEAALRATTPVVAAPAATGPVHACTIVARNYLPAARVFAESLKAVHPDAHVTVLVIDGPAEPSDTDRFRVLRLEDVLPDENERRRQTLMYDVTELSTAVKPHLLRWLLNEGAAAVLYFDPDIEFFAPIDDLWQLATVHQIVLTPHVLTPIPDDGQEITDVTVLRAGIFNLGFAGVGAGAMDFLTWWSDRLAIHCVSDPDRGLFVDQRWVDFVPALFPHHIVRDPGCNVAYWNLHERRVEQTPDGFRVNGVPLRFYHYSGFSPATPHVLSRHQGARPRALFSEHPGVHELCRRYAKRLYASGYGAVAAPAHATLPDGTPIDFVMRRVFRREVLRAMATNAPMPPEPYGWNHILDWFNASSAEAPRLSRYLFGLFEERVDLQREFRTPLGAGAEAYLNWVRHDPWACTSIPEALRPQPPLDVSTDIAHGDPATAEGLNIAGYFNAELGVGEVARLLTAASRNEGLPVATVVNDRTLSRQQAGFELPGSDVTWPVTLVCANADEFPRAVDALPSAMRNAQYRIGFWFWETERLPAPYASSADLLDEIWVASEHVADAIRPVVSRPVHICPLPVRPLRPAPIDRVHFNLPDGFLFLFMFDFLSTTERKNPVGLVRAFGQAFRPGEGPTLLLKSINGHLARHAREELLAAIGDRPDVRLIDEYLTSGERDALLQLCDAYVSLHRAEGYGLTMAEAMSLGKPTIATGYSGNLAFMTPENSFLVPFTRTMVTTPGGPYPVGHWWAEPDLDAAAAIMRGVYDNPGLARDRGERGRLDVTTRCSSSRTVAFIRERLASILQPPAPDVAPVDAVQVVEPVAEPIAEVVPEAEPDAPVVEPPQPRGLDPAKLAELRARLEQAERQAAEAAARVGADIPFGEPSRFGWPGQVLRTLVLRIMRPYIHFQARAHLLHLESTRQTIESLIAAASDPASPPDR